MLIKKTASTLFLQVGMRSNLQYTECTCSHLSTFASGFQIPMNTIDFSDSAWLHLADNPVAFAFGICVIGLYLVLLIWARKKDKLDTLLVSCKIRVVLHLNARIAFTRKMNNIAL